MIYTKPKLTLKIKDAYTICYNKVNTAGHCVTWPTFSRSTINDSNKVTNLLECKQRCCLHTIKYPNNIILRKIYTRLTRYNNTNLYKKSTDCLLLCCLFTFRNPEVEHEFELEKNETSTYGRRCPAPRISICPYLLYIIRDTH